jgi:hypothetical protein
MTLLELIRKLERHGVRLAETEVVINGCTADGETCMFAVQGTRVAGPRIEILAVESEQ